MEPEKPKSKVKEFLWNAAIVLLVLAIFLVGYKLLNKPAEEIKLSVDIFGCKQADLNLTSDSVISKYFDCVTACTEKIKDSVERKECYQACSQVSTVCKGV